MEISTSKSFSQQLTYFEKYLSQINFMDDPSHLYAPVAYTMESGGKRIRPALVLMANDLFSDNPEEVLPAALAVEVFHNFSLVHDDVMDEAPIRRGKPAVHEKYNLNTAILSGDMMLILAYRYLNLLQDKYIPEALRTFNRIAEEVCKGQQRDMDFEERSDVSTDEYLLMIEQKTAALVGGSLRLGAIVGNANEEQASLLENFGRSLGISFQLMDDYLDCFGDPEKFGKKIGGDIQQFKKTWLWIACQSELNSEEKKHFAIEKSNSADNEEAWISFVTDLYKEKGINQMVLAEANRYYAMAINQLQQLECPGDKEALLQFSAKLLARNT